MQDTLEEVQKGRDEYAAKAHGILQMEMFDTFFGLKLAHLIFSAAEQFSVNLQAKDITVQEAIHGAELLVHHLKSNQTESKFDLFYDQIIEQSSTPTEQPKLPRYRKMPRRFDEGENPHRYVEPKDRFRHINYDALELVAGEVERFNQPDLCVIKYLEVLYTNCSKINCTLGQGCISEALSKGDVDQARLKVQLLMIPDMIKIAFDGIIKSDNTKNTHRCNE